MRIQPKSPEELKARLLKRPLVLFGAGSLGMNIAEYCNSNGIPIFCFVDNKITGTKANKNILSPEKLKEECHDANIVISSNIFFDEIKQQLESLGFPQEQVLSYKLFLPDEVKWKDLDNTAEWERMRIRVKKMSEWIDENVHSIVDYGAGEMYLKTLLSSEVKYYPIDFIRRSEETILCDLNAGNFPDIEADAAMLSGILELLEPVESLLSHVCATTRQKILLTYMTLDKFPSIDGRRSSAYVNDFTENQLVDLLSQHGFTLKEKLQDPGHNVDTLFLFERTSILSKE